MPPWFSLSKIPCTWLFNYYVFSKYLFTSSGNTAPDMRARDAIYSSTLPPPPSPFPSIQVIISLERHEQVTALGELPRVEQISQPRPRTGHWSQPRAASTVCLQSRAQISYVAKAVFFTSLGNTPKYDFSRVGAKEWVEFGGSKEDCALETAQAESGISTSAGKFPHSTGLRRGLSVKC